MEPSIRSTGPVAVERSGSCQNVGLMTRHVTLVVSLLVLACAPAAAQAQTAPPQQKPARAARALDRSAERDAEHAVSIYRQQRRIDHDEPDSASRNPARAAQVRRARTIRHEFRDSHGSSIHQRVEQHGHRVGRLAKPALGSDPVLCGPTHHRRRRAIRKHVHPQGGIDGDHDV